MLGLTSYAALCMVWSSDLLLGVFQAEAELQEYEQLGGDFDQIVQEYADLQVRRVTPSRARQLGWHSERLSQAGRRIAAWRCAAANRLPGVCLGWQRRHDMNPWAAASFSPGAVRAICFGWAQQLPVRAAVCCDCADVCLLLGYWRVLWCCCRPRSGTWTM